MHTRLTDAFDLTHPRASALMASSAAGRLEAEGLIPGRQTVARIIAGMLRQVEALLRRAPGLR